MCIVPESPPISRGEIKLRNKTQSVRLLRSSKRLRDAVMWYQEHALQKQALPECARDACRTWGIAARSEARVNGRLEGLFDQYIVHDKINLMGERYLASRLRIPKYYQIKGLNGGILSHQGSDKPWMEADQI